MRTRSFILLAALAGLAGPVVADDEPEATESPWRIILKDQLKSEKTCDLNEVLHFQEMPLGDDVGLDGRVSCFDGRQFEFTRKRRHQKFTIQLCEPTIC